MYILCRDNHLQEINDIIITLKVIAYRENFHVSLKIHKNRKFKLFSHLTYIVYSNVTREWGGHQVDTTL